MIRVAVALTLALEIDVGLDKASDERARKRLQPVFAANVRRQRAHDVLEQMLLAVDRRQHAVVAIEHLVRQIQAVERRQIRARQQERAAAEREGWAVRTAKTEKADAGSLGTRRQSGLMSK